MFAPLLIQELWKDGCYKAFPLRHTMPLCTSVSGCFGYLSHTLSEKAGPPQVDQACVCVLWLAVYLSGLSGITPLQPQPMACPLGSVGWLFDGFLHSCFFDGILRDDAGELVGIRPENKIWSQGGRCELLVGRWASELSRLTSASPWLHLVSPGQGLRVYLVYLFCDLPHMRDIFI